MEPDPPLVRIAILEAAGTGARRSDGALVAVGESATARALNRLGSQVEVSLPPDVTACLALCRGGDIDLVVLDHPDLEACAPLLDALRSEGPPVVAVCGDDEQAVRAFRRGASDCVRTGDAFAEALPAVALEHIRRAREEREQGEAERRIRFLEQLNDAIVSEIPAGLAVIDGRERIVAVNPALSRTLGVHPSRAVGRHYDEVLPAELVSGSGMRELVAETAADRHPAPRLARWPGGADQAARIFDLRAQRLDDEGRILLVFSDITEREALTRRIEDLKRYNENIIQNMNSALLVTDRSGAITFANATAEQVLAAPPGSLSGSSIWDRFGSGSRDRALLARSLDDGERLKGAETVVRRDDGSVVPVGISCAPLVDADGASLGAVAIFQDLTEIKQLQRQVLQTEKMASIGQLAAGVAHEINNPMGFIHANLFQMSEYLGDLRRTWERVEQLQKAAIGGTLDEVRDASEALTSLARELDIEFVLGDFAKAIRESQEGSERIRHIVQDLRDFSYPDTAERVLADVNQCVDSTASIVWTMMKHSVVLQKDYQQLPQVRCFPMQLKQVFMNLLVNAYQAIHERIAGTGETGEIQIRTATARGGVSVTIQDTGVGIPAEDLARIFDPFFTTKEVGAGTGLGLSTSFNIVRRHGGTIHVDSVQGQGSVFEVWLPLGEGGANADEAPMDPDDVGGLP